MIINKNDERRALRNQNDIRIHIVFGKMGAVDDELVKIAHSPVHTAVARGDHAALLDIVNSLPRLTFSNMPMPHPRLLTQDELAEEDNSAAAISAALDRRDVPTHETALHMAVRLGDAVSADLLLSAGAEWILANGEGWHSVAHAISRADREIARVMVRHAPRLSWSRWCRALPALLAAMNRTRDFYTEIDVRLENPLASLVSFPSDTVRIWKRGSNLRADATFAGYDSALRLRRCHRSYVFLGRGGPDCPIPGSVLLLNHRDKQFASDFWWPEDLDAIFRPEDSEIEEKVNQMSLLGARSVGVDLHGPEIVPENNWMRHQKTEVVGNWKARMYEIREVTLRFKSGARSAAPGTGYDGDLLQSTLRMAGLASLAPSGSDDENRCKERTRSWRLRPVVGLAQDFPVQLEELMPLLDAFGGSPDGAVHCIREFLAPILASDLTPGTFPVKLAIPVIPTVKLVAACTKFEDFETRSEAPQKSKSKSKSPKAQNDSPSAVEDPFRVPDNYTWTSTRAIKQRIHGDKTRIFPFSFRWVIHALRHDTGH